MTSYVSMADADFARCRSTNFCSLPVDVFGNSPNSTRLGVLKPARYLRQWAMISSAVTCARSFSYTKAHGTSPHFGSGCATTAAAMTAGCRYSTSSTSMEEMFSPPEMMMSLLRSRMRR